ncbi:MAG TPA: flagellar hook capping FlgD N-terminal domain-containing protein [Terriglobia bacterium]|nr:flagellar hook capping FlgD N-terminal domain-containing protein [Terriglobia bacterium]
MTIHPMASTPASNPTSSSGAQSNNQGTPAGFQPQQITMSDFMTLLSAQLQGQDPTNPVDPTTFVTQLAQFTQLDEIQQIYGLLQSYVQGSGSTSGTPATNSGSGTPGASGSGTPSTPNGSGS